MDAVGKVSLPSARLAAVRITAYRMGGVRVPDNPDEGFGRLKTERGGYFLLEKGGYILTEKRN